MLFFICQKESGERDGLYVINPNGNCYYVKKIKKATGILRSERWITYDWVKELRKGMEKIIKVTIIAKSKVMNNCESLLFSGVNYIFKK